MSYACPPQIPVHDDRVDVLRVPQLDSADEHRDIHVLPLHAQRPISCAGLLAASH